MQIESKNIDKAIRRYMKSDDDDDDDGEVLRRSTRTRPFRASASDTPWIGCKRNEKVPF